MNKSTFFIIGQHAVIEALKNPSGNYKGYPFRTYGGSSFLGGYSDHFPVYMFLVKKAS